MQQKQQRYTANINLSKQHFWGDQNLWLQRRVNNAGFTHWGRSQPVPKHLSTFIRTALKVAPRGPNPVKRRPKSKNKKLGMGPSEKLVSLFDSLISERKKLWDFFSRKKTILGGGGMVI